MSTVGIDVSQRRRGTSITEEMEKLMEAFWVSGVEANYNVRYLLGSMDMCTYSQNYQMTS